MRRIVFVVVLSLMLPMTLGQGGEKKKKDGAANGGSDAVKQKDKADKDNKGDKDKKGGEKADKKNKDKEKNDDKSDWVPPGIAKQGNEKIAKWRGSKGRLDKDLDDIYNRDDQKRGNRDQLKKRAGGLYDKLTDMGMDPDDATKLIEGMARSNDKDSTYAQVQKALERAEEDGWDKSRAAYDVRNIVNGSENAALIGKGLKSWLKKK